MDDVARRFADLGQLCHAEHMLWVVAVRMGANFCCLRTMAQLRIAKKVDQYQQELAHDVSWCCLHVQL